MKCWRVLALYVLRFPQILLCRMQPRISNVRSTTGKVGLGNRQPHTCKVLIPPLHEGCLRQQTGDCKCQRDALDVDDGCWGPNIDVARKEKISTLTIKIGWKLMQEGASTCWELQTTFDVLTE